MHIISPTQEAEEGGSRIKVRLGKSERSYLKKQTKKNG
jgi:hypothetical protein